MARCVIISACPVAQQLAGEVSGGDFIIACDAGYLNCQKLGLRPNIIVGDFDSAPRPSVCGEDIVVLPHVKDDTDTEYAAKIARQKGFGEVLMLGALGGRRLEHTLASISTGLKLEYSGTRCELLDERSRLTYILPGEAREYKRGKYFYISVYPLEGLARGVGIKGAFYGLEGAGLTAQNFPLTTSNEYAAGSDTITVSTREGALLVIETIADNK